jgi:undecaprenyl diphosphate synthase
MFKIVDIKDGSLMGLKEWFKGKNNSRSKKLLSIMNKPIPNHVAIIMDGNGRWARQRNMPRTAGHRQGVEALRDIIQTSSKLGIRYLTLYAFSTENWKRPESEVRYLMSLMVEFLQKETPELHANNVRIIMLGQLDGLPDNARDEICKAMKATNDNTGLQVNIAINYGSRAEIVRAVQMVAKDVTLGKIALEDIDEDLFAGYLDTKGVSDPDLMIRTSGEYRLSNFLLYQSAYTELIFTDKNLLWPDFTGERYLEAIAEYQSRTRRFGGI